MPSALDRIDFGPPPGSGRVRAIGLAVLVHALLIAALTWGVSWKRSDSSPSFSAELWSSTVQQAAPPLPAAAAPTQPTPAPAEVPQQKVAPLKLPAKPNVDIALEQEKKRKLAQQKAEREQEDAQDKRQAAMDAKAEKEQSKKDEAKRLEAAKLAAAKLAATNKATAAAANAVSAAAVEAQRKLNLARMMGTAGATGDENATGTAKVSSGPSSGYGGKVRAKVKPNIVFTESIDGNPKAEVEVRSSLDGTITSQRLVKSSGNKAWDEAVIKAIVKTETMPRDTDGRVPPVMILEVRPRD